MAIFAGIVAGVVTATCIQWLLRETAELPTRVLTYPAFVILMMIVAVGSQRYGISPFAGVGVISAIVLALFMRVNAEQVPRIRPAEPPEIDAVRELGGLPFEARVQMRSVQQRLVTEFQAAIGGGDFHLHLASRDWAGDVHPDARLSVVESPDGPYVARSNNAAMAIEFLSGAWRDIVAADRLHVGSFLLEVRPGAMLIRAEGAIRERTRFNPFIECAVALARRLHDLLAGPPMVAEVVVAGGRCPVCGVELSGPVVHCRRCSTPHHGDCWSYNGMCAVYACRGREHTRGAQPAPPPLRMPVALPHRAEGFAGTTGTLAAPFPALVRNGTLTSAGRTVPYVDFHCEIADERGLVELTYRDSRRILGIAGGLREAMVAGFGVWDVREETEGDAERRLDGAAAEAVRAIRESTMGAVSVSMGRGRLYVRSTGPALDPAWFVEACQRLGGILRRG